MIRLSHGGGLVLALCVMVLVVGCGGAQVSSRDLGRAVEAGVVLSGRDQAEAARYGQAATALTGAVAEIDLETETALGGGVAVRAFNDIGPRYANENVQRYVTLVGKAVARQAERPNLPYSFAVLDSPTPNAFAGPGGYIFITTGALMLMEDEAQLAGVLAHEIAHASQGHMIQMYRRSRTFDALFTAASAVREDVQRYNEAVDNATTTLFDRGLDQRFEFEADQLGTEMAALTGYDPTGLKRFLQALGRVQGESGGWFRTHPSSSSRIQRLDRQLSTDLAGVEGVVNRDRFQREVAQRLRAGSANAGQRPRMY